MQTHPDFETEEGGAFALCGFSVLAFFGLLLYSISIEQYIRTKKGMYVPGNKLSIISRT
jgi:hypothetical protein